MKIEKVVKMGPGFADSHFNQMGVHTFLELCNIKGRTMGRINRMAINVVLYNMIHESGADNGERK